VNKVCDELEVRIKNGEGAYPQGYPRVITSGCPMAIPNWKIPSIVETSGAVIVGEESCVGERGTRWFTDEEGETVEQLMTNILTRYYNVDCAIFTPNPSRLEHVQNMVKKYSSQGVVHYNLQFCQPYQVESGIVETRLENGDIPFLRIDTDYSQEDTGQIKTRIEAFIERINV
jgi:benzoyl-CoA reductase/2-hydroxyglutaryl-CoA dehydratase subunit BcrC/BadD/HgdB